MNALVILATAIVPAGLTVAVIAFLRAGIAREESDRSLFYDPETRAAAVTRRIVGLYIRTPRGVDSAGDVRIPASCEDERRSQ